MNEQTTKSSCPACGARASGKFCEQCGTALTGPSCGSCDAPLPVGARFCSECGTPAGQGLETRKKTTAATQRELSPKSSAATVAPWVLAAVLLISVVAYVAGNATTAGDAGAAPAGMPPGAAPFANGGGSGGAPPDISAMSPRERASRLYDRIMRYVEQGKPDSAQFFAPMALTSFEVLGPELDTDARYDYGRVAAETGNLVIAAAQADTILKAAPTHLLGLALRARTELLKGDAAGAAKTWKAFQAAREAELKKTLPEYQMHATDIEQATKLASGGK